LDFPRYFAFGASAVLLDLVGQFNAKPTEIKAKA
jgi:hypothetical protein